MKVEDMTEEMNDMSRRLMALSENVIDMKTQLSILNGFISQKDKKQE